MSEKFMPSHAKVGDIFLRKSSGGKVRPLVVVGFFQNNGLNTKAALAIPLTSKECWGIEKAKSRFLGNNSYFSCQIEAVGEMRVKDHLVGVYEDLSHLKQVKLLVMKKLKENIIF